MQGIRGRHGSIGELNGLNHLTPEERSRMNPLSRPKGCTGASGGFQVTHEVWLRVPKLGKRRFLVSAECPPLISAYEQVVDYSSFLYWDKERGPCIETCDGTVIQLDTNGLIDRVPCKGDRLLGVLLPATELFGCHRCRVSFEQGCACKSAPPVAYTRW